MNLSKNLMRTLKIPMLMLTKLICKIRINQSESLLIIN